MLDPIDIDPNDYDKQAECEEQVDGLQDSIDLRWRAPVEIINVDDDPIGDVGVRPPACPVR